MVDFIAGSAKFILKYLLQIVLVILILVMIMVYLTVHNIHFAKRHPKLQRIVEIEGFLPQSQKDLALSLCEQNHTEADGGEANCNTLGYNACNLTDCCGWAVSNSDKDDKCVAATALGMVHRTHADNVDSLYFQYKKVNI